MDGTQETVAEGNGSHSISSSAPPKEDTLGLRRVRGDIPGRLWAVASIGFWERAAFWGLTAPWQNYMQHPPPLSRDGTPGALGLGQVKATRIYCAFYIGYYITPIIFAVISDSRLGRYKTLLLSLIHYNIGCAVLTFTSLEISLEKGWGLPGLIIAMVLIGLGGGGFQSIMSAFLADQCAEEQPRIKVLKSGERVVTDRSLTLEYIYNLYYWLGNVGSLSWFATVCLEKNTSFTAAYGLTFGFMVAALLVLVIGRKRFVRTPHEAGVLPQAVKILKCAARHGFRLARADPAYQLQHRHKAVPWSSRLVAELCRGLRACRVLLAFVVFYVCFDQMQNNLISQASQMETYGTPNDLLPAMNQVGCILFVPLTQHVLFPYLHKRGIYLKPIVKITIGFLFIALAMLYATLVQHAIYSTGPCYEHPKYCGAPSELATFGLSGPNHVNVWIQAPIYFFIALGEIFSLVTALEYAYSHAPKDMKAIVQSISLLIAGVGSACALGLSSIAHDPSLVIFYASLASTMAVTAAIFWFLFRRYDKCPTFHGAEDTERTMEVIREKNRISLERKDRLARVRQPSVPESSLTASEDKDLEHGFPFPAPPERAAETHPRDSTPTLVNLFRGEESAEESEKRQLALEERTTHDEAKLSLHPPETRWATPVSRLSTHSAIKGIEKETLSTTPKLDASLHGSFIEDNLNNSMPSYYESASSSPLSSRRSSLYESADEHPASTNDDILDNRDASTEELCPPLTAEPRASAHITVPVPALVAHFEHLSHRRSNSDLTRPAASLQNGTQRPRKTSH